MEPRALNFGPPEAHTSEPLAHPPSSLQDFHGIWPEKFQNKTNGVTQVGTATAPIRMPIFPTILMQRRRTLCSMPILGQVGHVTLPHMPMHNSLVLPCRHLTEKSSSCLG